MLDGIQNCTRSVKSFFTAASPSSLQGRIAALALALLLYCRPAIGFAALSAYVVSQTISMKQPDDPVIAAAPQFNGYKLGKGTSYRDTPLMSLSIRPANLFYRALLGSNAEVLPESGELFAFRLPHEKIRKQILSADPAQTISFSAVGVPAKIYPKVYHKVYQGAKGDPVLLKDLGDILGGGVYRMSYGELQSTLASQKIYTSPILPLPFYKALKAALIRDRVTVLPGSGKEPVKVSAISSPYAKALIKRAFSHPAEYGFKGAAHAKSLLDLTLYQVGALVVKSEDYRVFLDEEGKLLERHIGDPDAIRLINACGIRGIHVTPETGISNRTIMQQAFKTALAAAEKDIVIFPAVGMGVWAGDPGLYWRAFLDAVAMCAGPIEKIYVNPGHQPTPYGRYTGCKGEEFRTILSEYRARFKDDAAISANLAKITNLYDRKTDVVQLARLLKRSYPDKTVSLFNASDPDVTLGNHVGEYVNSLNGNCTTTEENYTALGTNGLCFETITGVHEDPSRVVSIKK